MALRIDLTMLYCPHWGGKGPGKEGAEDCQKNPGVFSPVKPGNKGKETVSKEKQGGYFKGK